MTETTIINDEEFEAVCVNKVKVSVKIKSTGRFLLSTGGERTEEKRQAMNSFGQNVYYINKDWTIKNGSKVRKFEDGMLI